MTNLTGGAAILAKLRASKEAKAAEAAGSAVPAPGSTLSSTEATAPAPVAPVAPAEPAPPSAPVLTGSAALLAKMRSQKASAKPSAPTPEVVFLYASQTGTGQEVAKTLQSDASTRGFRSRVLSFNELGFDDLTPEKTPFVVFVASSTGDGDPPDNGAKFYVKLRKKDVAPGSLKGIQYTCMGLGDSNYTRYMHIPRQLRSRFEDLGAVAFYPPGEADEVDGIEEKIDSWTQGLWPALAQAIGGLAATREEAPPAAEKPAAVVEVTKLSSRAPAHGPFPLVAAGTAAESPAPCPVPRVVIAPVSDEARAAAVLAVEKIGASAEALSHRDPQGHYSLEAPLYAAASRCRLLTNPASDRRVIELQLDLAGSGITYRPGDAVAIAPENDPAAVEALLARLGWAGDQVFEVKPTGADSGTGLLPHLGAPCSLRRALARGCDITGPVRKTLLRVLAEYTADAEEKATLLYLCSRSGRDAFREQVEAAQPTLLDLLLRFPSCQPDAAALLDALPPLMPRAYSITSAPSDLPEAITVALSVVRQTTPYGAKNGVATNFIDRTCLRERGEGPAPRLAVFLKPSLDFAPPADLSKPWIMVGPGTGVAPFRGFLQDRRSRLREGGAAGPGEAWLYFGCRREDEDYIYAEDLQAFAADKTLAGLRVAFSRQTEGKKVYVQHLIEADAERLAALIVGQGGYVFVCGDGLHMAKDVHAAFAAAIDKHGGLTEGSGADYLAGMVREKRYVRDIWAA